MKTNTTPTATTKRWSPPSRARPAVDASTETFLAGIMESFARMQAETNRTLVETLRTLPFNGNGAWNPRAGATPHPAVSPPPAATPAPATTPPPADRAASSLSSATTGGNFSKCTARFDGSSRDAEVLEAFIDAVQV